jgi:hypothetical protein
MYAHTFYTVANPHPLRNYHAGNGTNSKRRAELRPPPSSRTNHTICRDAIANRDHEGYKKDAPYKTSGIKEVSPLSFLPLFDMVWDILPDIMHVVPVMWKGHIFPMFRATRIPAQVKPRKKYTDEENEQLMRDHDEAKEHLEGWALSKVHVTKTITFAP